MAIQREQRRFDQYPIDRINIILAETIDRFAFGEELPYLLVEILDRCLLVALECVAEKQVCSLSARLFGKLNPGDIGKAWVPIGEDRGEHLIEFVVSDPVFQSVECVNHFLGIPVFDNPENREVYFRYNDDEDRLDVFLDGSRKIHLTSQLVYMRFLIS